MKDWERRQALGDQPKPRKGGPWNMTMTKEHIRLGEVRWSGTDFNVLHHLLGIVDHDGYAVITVEQLAHATKRSVSGVTTALRRLQDAGKIKRVGRSGFRFNQEVLTPQNERSRG